MTAPAAHRPSSREAMIAAAEDWLRDHGTLSLETAAAAAGVTKPGLMYHFSTKEALMTAVLENVIGHHETDLRRALGLTQEEKFTDADPAARITAYVQWACSGEFESADLVMFADPRLREPLTQRWSERVEPWLLIPAHLPPSERANLLAARLIADGMWFNLSSGLLEITPEQRRETEALALDLIGAARA